MAKSNQFEVSIIILSYNPDYNKFIGSIRAALRQQNVSFEIIIADDGSKEDFFPKIKEFFQRISFADYRLIKNKNNVGTVCNCLSAIKKSRAEYVFINSPGDFLFDPNTLRDFYRFAKNMHADVCFGDYIPYYCCENTIKYDEYILPKNTMVYDKGIKNYKISFLMGDGICGASYFRSKKFAMMSFQYIAKHSKYVEDGTTTAFALVNNIPVHYYNRTIVWYEYGNGISTCQNDKWNTIIETDFAKTYQALLIDYPTDRVLKAALFYIKNKSTRYWTKLFIFKYPIISVRKRLLRSNNSRRATVLEEEKEYLKELMHNDR